MQEETKIELKDPQGKVRATIIERETGVWWWFLNGEAAGGTADTQQGAEEAINQHLFGKK